jgi:hypothetical protein
VEQKVVLCKSKKPRISVARTAAPNEPSVAKTTYINLELGRECKRWWRSLKHVLRSALSGEMRRWFARSPTLSPESLPTTNFDNGFNIPAAGRARSRSSNARCVHPSLKYRERCLRYPTGSNRSRFRQYPLDHDSGTFPTLRRRTADSHLFRTRWPTVMIMSILGGIVGMYVEYSTGDWREKDRTNSAGPSSMQLGI